MLIVNYHTPNYAGYATDLVASLNSFGYRHDVRCVEIAGDWHERAIYKAAFVRSMWAEHREPLLWIDADAVVERPIDFGMFAGCDFACAWFDTTTPRHLSAGTAYFAQTPAAGQLLDDWLDACRTMSGHGDGDQTPLQAALANQTAIVAAELPPEYAWIEPTPGVPDISRIAYGDRNPVIRHRQASRHLR